MNEIVRASTTNAIRTQMFRIDHVGDPNSEPAGVRSVILLIILDFTIIDPLHLRDETDPGKLATDVVGDE